MTYSNNELCPPLQLFSFSIIWEGNARAGENNVYRSAAHSHPSFPSDERTDRRRERGRHFISGMHGSSNWGNVIQIVGYSLLLLVPRISELCLISVWNLSENCQLQKTVRKVSEMCLISVINLSDSELCHKYVRWDLEMSPKCVITHNCVRKLSVSFI